MKNKTEDVFLLILMAIGSVMMFINYFMPVWLIIAVALLFFAVIFIAVNE